VGLISRRYSLELLDVEGQEVVRVEATPEECAAEHVPTVVKLMDRRWLRHPGMLKTLAYAFAASERKRLGTGAGAGRRASKAGGCG
jgi:hypothetical protein